MSALPPDAVSWTPRQWRLFCEANPKTVECEQVPDYYEYQILLVPNAVFIALFGISLMAFVGAWGWKRRGHAFTFAMSFGVIGELIGYVGRVLSYENPWAQIGFMMQICCLTIAPAFLAAGIYLCLRRIVRAFGKENSRISPEAYTRIFIPCDVVSLILQAAGGAMASLSSQGDEYDRTGDWIMIAGLAFQVVVLLAFVIVSGDFAIRVWRRHRSLGAAALDQHPDLIALRGSLGFKGFLGALLLATLCIFWRSVFRVAELSGGWSGPLMARQDLFIAFEGVLIVVAAVAVNIFNPILWCGALFDKRYASAKKNKRQKSARDLESSSEEA